MSASKRATLDLASWIVGRNDAPAPTDRALALAELAFVDTIACMLAGTREPGPWALKRTRQTDESMPASLIGMGTAVSVQDAALLNGMLAHMLDFDDGDMVSRSHPSCVLVPALLAAAEDCRRSGRALLEAYLVGYYVIQLVGRVCGLTMAKRGFHVTGMAGMLGATAGLCRLRDLTVDQTATALGIAATTAGGLRANFGTDMKPYHAGRGAASAIEAVEMALAGVTASHSILESKDGFVWVLADPELADLIAVEVDSLLAGNYSIEAEPPNIKLYACCFSSHANIVALLRLRPQLIDRLNSIREIVAEAPHAAARYLIHTRPTNGLEGKFSMEAAVAVALLDGRAGVEEFTDESIQRCDVQALLRKVRFETSERMEAIRVENLMPGAVTVFTEKETLSELVRDPRGCRSDPCDLPEVIAKLRDCARGVLTSEGLDQAVTSLSSLRNIQDVSQLCRRLRGIAPEVATPVAQRFTEAAE